MAIAMTIILLMTATGRKNLEGYEIIVIHFDDLEVKQKIDSVVREIIHHIEDIVARWQTPL